MSTLTDALAAYYQSKTPPVAAPVGIRQDLGLQPTVLGYSNDAVGLERYDADSALRIKARAPGVSGALQAVAVSYNWQVNPDVVGLATDALRFRVLGDMALKAIRTDPSYRDIAREYFRQADESIKAAGAVMVDEQKVGAGDPGPAVAPPVSQSARVRAVW